VAVTEFTSAPAGTGKTAMRCARYLAFDFLPSTDLTLYTNYPINIDAMVAYVIQHYPDMVESRLRDRIKIIPEDVLKDWRQGQSSPLDYFQRINLDGCRIAIDEIHNFCGLNTPKPILQAWREFLGEIRHRGCEFECLSQNESKIAKVIKDEAGLKRYLFNSENKPDPFFGIRMEDWYELRAKFSGRYAPWIFETIHTEVHGKWRETKELSRMYQLSPDLFPLYDSYSAPHHGGNKSKGRVHPFQSLTTVGLFLWFFRRNWFRFLSRFLIAAFVFWLCFCGGMSMSMHGFLSLVERMKPSSSATAPSVVESNGTPSLDKISKLSAQNTDKDHILAISKLEADLAARDKELDQMKTENARFTEIVALFGDQVTLRCGVTVDVGEQIPLGPLKGRSIKGINHAKRRVMLDDSTVLPLSP
jgi:hypothetical protein